MICSPGRWCWRGDRSGVQPELLVWRMAGRHGVAGLLAQARPRVANPGHAGWLRRVGMCLDGRHRARDLWGHPVGSCREGIQDRSSSRAQAALVAARPELCRGHGGNCVGGLRLPTLRSPSAEESGWARPLECAEVGKHRSVGKGPATIPDPRRHRVDTDPIGIHGPRYRSQRSWKDSRHAAQYGKPG